MEHTKAAEAKQAPDAKASERRTAAQVRQRHQLTLKNRERMSVEGVTDVESFDQQEVLVETDGGPMTIRGEGLHIKELNVETSTLQLEGRIRSIEYGDESAAQKGKGLLGRLFR